MLIPGSRLERHIEQNIAKKRRSIADSLAELADYAKTLPNDEQIIVFGSAARGEAQEHSDVDILIDAKTPSRAAEIEMDFYRLFAKRDLATDVRWLGYCTPDFIEATKEDWLILRGD